MLCEIMPTIIKLLNKNLIFSFRKSFMKVNRINFTKILNVTADENTHKHEGSKRKTTRSLSQLYNVSLCRRYNDIIFFFKVQTFIWIAFKCFTNIYSLFLFAQCITKSTSIKERTEVFRWKLYKLKRICLTHLNVKVVSFPFICRTCNQCAMMFIKLWNNLKFDHNLQLSPLTGQIVRKWSFVLRLNTNTMYA